MSEELVVKKNSGFILEDHEANGPVIVGMLEMANNVRVKMLGKYAATAAPVRAILLVVARIESLRASLDDLWVTSARQRGRSSDEIINAASPYYPKEE